MLSIVIVTEELILIRCNKNFEQTIEEIPSSILPSLISVLKDYFTEWHRRFLRHRAISVFGHLVIERSS